MNRLVLLLAICSVALQGIINARVLALPLCSVAISVNASESVRLEKNDQAGFKELDLERHQIRDGLNPIHINVISGGVSIAACLVATLTVRSAWSGWECQDDLLTRFAQGSGNGW